MSTEIFEKGLHGDLDGKTFAEIYQTREKWVQFTLIWKTATGQYDQWLRYCRLRSKDEKKQVTR